MSSNLKENIKIVLGFIIATVLLIYIVVQIVAPELSVKVFGFKPYVVITESMEPEINVRDMVFVKQFNLQEAEVGDIITFKADIDYNGSKEVVTHYIYAINTNGEDTIIQTTRHWENPEDARPDTWILHSEDVLGTYWFKIPALGYVTDFLKSPFGIAAILVNTTIIISVVYLVKKGKESSEEV